MRDLTEGSIVRHILVMAAPLAISMVTQIAYQLVDLYFLTRLSVAAAAGVNAAGIAGIVVISLTQMLGVGTLALVAHAVGRRDAAEANLIFNQSMLLSVTCGVAMMTFLYMFTRSCLKYVAADAAMLEAGATFLRWILPGYASLLPMAVLSSALRGTGVVRPTIAFYMLTVVLNAILAPILIAGWGTGAALGVRGAGLATSISIVLGTVLLAVYFRSSQRYLRSQLELMRPQMRKWAHIITVGLPAGCEVGLMLLSAAVVYYVIRDFGAAAQAGYAVGWRVLQTILLPGMAIALAAGPIVGQNFGAKNENRVRETVRKTALIGSAMMILTTLFVQWQSATLVRVFDADALTTAVATSFLQLMSWSLLAQGLVYTCASTFQGLGNTVPSLISSATCFLLFAVPTVWLSGQPNFQINHVWCISIGTVTFQAMLSLYLLRLELKRRLLPFTPLAVRGNETATVRS